MPTRQLYSGKANPNNESNGKIIITKDGIDMNGASIEEAYRQLEVLLDPHQPESADSELQKELKEIQHFLIHAQDDEISHHQFRCRAEKGIGRASQALSASVQGVDRWISVEDDLPKDAKPVIIEGGCGHYSNKYKKWFTNGS